ncbi:hypothetical protein CYMTET_27562 [Cymbomonas tetramitiformis]|uniref:Uncharacterized protein n=1 Tax=Cymbomonas tetramitiformis TaxID=36881 RepID=A0AAE0KWU5_9CHLO|nr:hypothetical protein CYMTET_27562 [Cymbomonas tetramitiformis]
MQRALAGVPGIEQPKFDEEWAAAAAASRKRRAMQRPVGSEGEDSKGEEQKRAAARARFGSLRTATDEELRRALDGSLSVKDIARPSGELVAPVRPILPAGGALRGLDIRVSRPWGDVEEGGAEWRLDAKRGLVLEAKAKHCRSFDEWDETFTTLICKAPEDARDLLFQFRRWMKLMSIDYSWDRMRKFYDYLCTRMEREASTTFELVSYTAHWELYKRDKGIKMKGTGGGGGGIGSRLGGVNTPARCRSRERMRSRRRVCSGTAVGAAGDEMPSSPACASRPARPRVVTASTVSLLTSARSVVTRVAHITMGTSAGRRRAPGGDGTLGVARGGPHLRGSRTVAGGAQGAPDGGIVAEPEEMPEEHGTMASDDREPEPAGEVREMQARDAEPWWARLRRMLVAPVWDAAGAPQPAAQAAGPAALPAGAGERYYELDDEQRLILRAAFAEAAKELSRGDGTPFAHPLPSRVALDACQTKEIIRTAFVWISLYDHKLAFQRSTPSSASTVVYTEKLGTQE